MPSIMPLAISIGVPCQAILYSAHNGHGAGTEQYGAVGKASSPHRCLCCLFAVERPLDLSLYLVEQAVQPQQFAQDAAQHQGEDEQRMYWLSSPLFTVVVLRTPDSTPDKPMRNVVVPQCLNTMV